MNSATAQLPNPDSGAWLHRRLIDGRAAVARGWRGPASDPVWARPALVALLLLTAVAYLCNLTANGYANSFYSAAAQAGSVNWEAFLFGSSDAANSITVDKPPASLWVMALSVRAFGLSSFSLLMPQVVMGVATVAVLYATVRRSFGAVAGLIAAAVLAVTPVAVLMFRFNNPDALLVLLMTLAAWATLRAIERGSARWMAVTGVFIGLGFLTKTLQVMLVVPFLGLAFLIAARTGVRGRIKGALAGVGAMVVTAGCWVAVVELVPASSRPYVGGSQDNSFWNLTFGYNGFGRLTGNETGSVMPGGDAGPGGAMWGQTGLWRMFSTQVGGQISWLMPSALILLVAGIALRGRRPRTDLRRAAYLVWGGWLVVTALTFSLMAGIFHEYYTVALAPAVAALVGMGAQEAWERRGGLVGSAVLASAAGAAAVWSFVLLSRTTAYAEWLRFGVLVAGAVAALLLLAVRSLDRRFVPVAVGLAVITGLAGPTAYSVSTIRSPHTGSIVTAGPVTRGGFPGGGGGFTGPPAGAMPPQRPAGTMPQRPAGGGMPRGGGLLEAGTPTSAVVTALHTDSSRFTWVAATVGSQSAAGLQLATGDPVMAIGGFSGSDPSPTLAQFQADVAAGRIHYFLPGGGGPGQGAASTASRISAWVQAHYRAVTIGNQTFYDLTQPKP
ncbi:glycosyltransferase family 39 protein [Calidifontibacter sp. DB0510]|uniref:Glycosyltransferase family 39 protein n=1 Tax=Metallococcus carri TaxID=1656884 RepID=A0A967B7R1_9MICO|nr:glycosyltransferase family 39 protein [Metallococcus carri]NHN56306.1 glycosyltransferase family 39 protein [Metallococcus carri]NOP38642.1 glycosyltransferase family 39 protein [Calidifontibacter sp. DB2511S]